VNTDTQRLAASQLLKKRLPMKREALQNLRWGGR